MSSSNNVKQFPRLSPELNSGQSLDRLLAAVESVEKRTELQKEQEKSRILYEERQRASLVIWRVAVTYAQMYPLNSEIGLIALEMAQEMIRGIKNPPRTETIDAGTGNL